MCHAVLCRVLQEQQLYPCVGMRTKHEEIRANFGGAPFCVDLNKLHVSGWVGCSLCVLCCVFSACCWRDVHVVAVHAYTRSPC
jgi:hypothetical protein